MGKHVKQQRVIRVDLNLILIGQKVLGNFNLWHSPASPELKMTVGDPPDPGRGGATGGGGGGVGMDESSLVRQGGGGGGGGRGRSSRRRGVQTIGHCKDEERKTCLWWYKQSITWVFWLVDLKPTCVWHWWWWRRWGGWGGHAWSFTRPHVVIGYSLRAAEINDQ